MEFIFVLTLVGFTLFRTASPAGSEAVLGHGVSLTPTLGPAYFPLPDESTPGTYDPASLFITLERFPGFCRCPSYRLNVYEDGAVTFQGFGDVEASGFHTSTVSLSRVEELVHEVKKADFFELSSDYPPVRLDGPSSVLTVNLDGKSKKAWDAANPPSLRTIMSRIDQIVNADQWIK